MRNKSKNWTNYANILMKHWESQWLSSETFVHWIRAQIKYGIRLLNYIFFFKFHFESELDSSRMRSVIPSIPIMKFSNSIVSLPKLTRNLFKKVSVFRNSFQNLINFNRIQPSIHKSIASLLHRFAHTSHRLTTRFTRKS